MASGPKFIRFFWPVLAGLRDLGGSASPADVVDLAVERVGIGDEERAERTKSGSLRVDNQVHWARNYLVWAGLLDGSKRGQWTLSPAGWEISLDDQDLQSAHELFKQVRAERGPEWGNAKSETEPTDIDSDAEESDESVAPVDKSELSDISLINDLRATVQGVSPSGFEGLCKRLLTEIGLKQLRAVGQSGDRGIDVEGHLRVNSVVSFRVGVQCKLYSDGNKVTPRQIREFQGALGPFDRGIFMTTSVFTHQAEEQASSPGYKPIDLIDGERLIDLLREYQLGVEEVTMVDASFFAPYL